MYGWNWQRLETSGVIFWSLVQGILLGGCSDQGRSSPSGELREEPRLEGGGSRVEGGVRSSEQSYHLPIGCPVQQQAILTTGDGPSGYRLAGRPGGLGAFDNGDDTFTLLVGHGLGKASGSVRTHGASGAYVSKWRVRKHDLAVMEGGDLVEQVAAWDPARRGYAAPRTGIAFDEFGSADLPAASALLDGASGLGFDGRLFFNGETSSGEGRAWVHDLDGTSYEFPRMGKAGWRNVVANPGVGRRTVVIGIDGGSGGQLYVYVGEKTSSGSPVERAGLTNGTLFGIRVVGSPIQHATRGLSDARVELASLGNVENASGAELEDKSAETLVTGFDEPRDGAWDPTAPNDFYFVTKGTRHSPSRLLRLRFASASSPELGGKLEVLLDGTEGPSMLGSVAVDRKGHAYLQEAPGNDVRLAKIWRYDLASDQLSEVARHESTIFSPGSSAFVTENDESSGIIDASDILGPSRFLLATEVHAAVGDPELVEGGQLSMMFDNDGLGGVMATLATLMVKCTGTIGPDSFVLDAEGFLTLPDGFRCSRPEAAEQSLDGEIRSYLSLQYPRLETVPGDPASRLVIPHGKECIAGRWALWKNTVAQTGITQEQCPVWTETGSFRPNVDAQLAELAKSRPLVRDEDLRESLADSADADSSSRMDTEHIDLEPFRSFTDFDVTFQQARPNHACAKQGPAACAAVCAGAFPGFVVRANGQTVKTDPMTWHDQSIFPDPWLNPYLRRGFFHPNWQYGETFANRNRANNCGARGFIYQQCNRHIQYGPAAGTNRSCSDYGIDWYPNNCASELCSVPISGTEYKVVRFRLSCTISMAGLQPGTPAWTEAWNSCVSHCYLGP